jgi:hypothetical protein
MKAYRGLVIEIQAILKSYYMDEDESLQPHAEAVL